MNDELLLDPHADGKKQSRGNMFTGLYEWVEAAIFSLICVVLVFTFLFRVVGVDGPSMTPTLLNTERLIMTNLNYTPERGDIVVINRYTQEPLVKRIIALAGDYLEIDGETGEVRVNGETLNETYIQGTTYPKEFQSPQTVPDNCVFVMGDNRNASTDSRDARLGCVDERYIMGRVYFTLFPVKNIGVVK